MKTPEQGLFHPLLAQPVWVQFIAYNPSREVSIEASERTPLNFLSTGKGILIFPDTILIGPEPDFSGLVAVIEPKMGKPATGRTDKFDS